MSDRYSTSDQGSGSVLMLAIIGLAVGVILLGALVAGIATARTRAQTAADLGAIAAAGHYERQRVTFTDNPDAACARGRDVVQRNDADLLSCEIQDDRSVVIRVRVASSLSFVRMLAEARAGPAEESQLFSP